MTSPTLQSAAPVFQVADIGETMRWYETHLGFRPHPFPAKPPHVFCVLVKDRVEIMLQRIDDHAPLDGSRRRGGGIWHVYLRMNGVTALFETLRHNAAIDVIEELHKQPYGDTEFVIRDPNGYLIVFSEGPPG
jgi:uncharacterized glyoxalase superfamily protein PhnB